MNSQIKVFGHQSPDTDATCSAIVWAWFIKNHRGQDAQAFILGTPNSEAQFVVKHWGVEMPQILEGVSSEDSVAIVDTNNADELFPNINDAHFVSIIDHHKLTGGLKTTSPREIIIQPYASTMTVMYNVMNIDPADFPREIAGLMLSGILSDTLAFRSPTTTDADKDLGQALAQALGIDIPTYSSQMFEAKSDISNFSALDLVRLDSKMMELQGKQMRISVLETTSPQTVLDRSEEIVQAMDQVKNEDLVDMVLLFIVDILKQESTVLLPDDQTKDLIKKSFDVDVTNDTCLLPGVVSRKKQIIPALS
jgi:manganese-dependent inorganic pyrophosphatase